MCMCFYLFIYFCKPCSYKNKGLRMNLKNLVHVKTKARELERYCWPFPTRCD